ncbi:hypothetical protein [Aminipila luticellarii]|nr:hypothetical protein [Aminipila luticellarii]
MILFIRHLLSIMREGDITRRQIKVTLTDWGGVKTPKYIAAKRQ